MVAPFMSGLAKYIAKAKGLASSLTKSETKALKNLLGVGKQQQNVVSDVVNQEDNDEAAFHLLSLLKNGTGSGIPASPAPSTTNTNTSEPSVSSDRKILLDLLNQGNNGSNEVSSEEHQLESAKEILSLLRNELDQSTQQQPLVPPTLQPPPMFNGTGGPVQFEGNGYTNFYPPMPPPSHIPNVMPPPMVYPGFGFMPPLPPQQELSEPVKSAPPVTPSMPDYNSPEAPPLPPHMSSLLSLLNSRKSGHKSVPSGGAESAITNDSSNVPSSPKQSDRRYDSMNRDNKPLKLSDLAGTGSNQTGGLTLLSLLNKQEPQPEAKKIEQERELKPGDSLMDLLQPKSSLSSVIAVNNGADNLSTNTTNGSSSGTSLMTYLNNQPLAPALSDSVEHPRIQLHSDPSSDLMELLNPGMSLRSGPQVADNTTYGQESSQSAASASLMNLLGVGSSPSPSSTTRSQQPFYDSSIINASTPVLDSPIQQSQTATASASTSLMDLLKPKELSTSIPTPTSAPIGPLSPASDIKPSDTSDSEISRSLMDLLNASSSTPANESQATTTPPAIGAIGAIGSRQSTPSYGAVGESRITSANRQSSSGQNLLNILNLGQQSSPVQDSISPHIDPSDGGKSLMALLNKTSASPEPLQSIAQPSGTSTSSTPIATQSQGKSLMQLLNEGTETLNITSSPPPLPDQQTVNLTTSSTTVAESVDPQKFISFLKDFASGAYA